MSGGGRRQLRPTGGADGECLGPFFQHLSYVLTYSWHKAVKFPRLTH